MMKTYAYTIDLIDDPKVIEKYKKWHKEIFPEVLEAGRAMGIKAQRIFLFQNRLFMTMEVDDGFDPDNMQHYAKGEREKTWDETMRSLQKPLPDVSEGWAQMELVFDREWFERQEERK